ncbi:F-box/FBD/LRR-repeat protein-like protein [Tanacetum coccineum]
MDICIFGNQNTNVVEANLRGPIGLGKWASIFVNIWFSSAPSERECKEKSMVQSVCVDPSRGNGLPSLYYSSLTRRHENGGCRLSLLLGNHRNLAREPGKLSFRRRAGVHVANKEVRKPVVRLSPVLFDLTDEGLAELQCINVIELFKRLPVIEDLSISQWIIKYCDDVPPELPIALVHLKRFRFSAMMLLDEFGLKFVFLVNNDDYLDYEMYKEYRYSSDALKDCADIWLEHLKELEIRDFANLIHEMKFVKLILDRAPMLKKVRIFQRYSSNRIKRDKELKIVRNVLRSSPRVSPLAEIIVQRDD